MGGLSTGMNISASLSLRAVGLASRTLLKKVVTGTLLVARAARIEAMRCIRTPRRCRLNANVLITGGDMPHTARHIRDAQLGHGSSLVRSPFWLNRDERTAGKGARRWYRNMQQCNSGSRTQFAAANGNRGACDEYPFYSTRQGGRRNYPSIVSLRLVNLGEAGRQGALIRTFYRRCGVRQQPVTKSRFISLGVPELPSSFLCLGRR